MDSMALHYVALSSRLCSMFLHIQTVLFACRDGAYLSGMPARSSPRPRPAAPTRRASPSSPPSPPRSFAQVGKVAAGRSDVVDVVTAVAESEAAIETLVAVRDRVIAAYEEIMRMPV